MKNVYLWVLVVLYGTGAGAQTPDSTRHKTSTPAGVPAAAGTRAPNPNAQRNGLETYTSTEQVAGTGMIMNVIDHRYEGLHGTPYFLPEWSQGRIEMVGGINYIGVPIKFDSYRQALVLLRSPTDSIIVDADKVKTFQLTRPDKSVYLFRRFPEAKTADTKAKDGYFMVLYQGKTSLLKRIGKTFRAADYKGAYSNNIRYDQFRDVLSYYILKPDQTLEKVKLTEKSLLDALNDRSDALKKALDSHPLNLKTETDAIRLVQLYDTL